MWKRRCAGLAVAGLVLMTAACSGGSSGKSASTSSTTAVPINAGTIDASTKAAVTAYLQGPGAPLVTFHRESAPLATGKPLTQQQCRTLQASLTRQPDRQLLLVATNVPDNTMKSKLQDDVFTKGLLLDACASLRPVKMYVWTGMARYHKQVTGLLEQYGFQS